MAVDKQIHQSGSGMAGREGEGGGVRRAERGEEGGHEWATIRRGSGARVGAGEGRPVQVAIKEHFPQFNGLFYDPPRPTSTAPLVMLFYLWAS